MKRYNSTKPPDYDLTRVSTPVVLMYAENDWLADPTVRIQKKKLVKIKFFFLMVKLIDFLTFSNFFRMCNNWPKYLMSLRCIGFPTTISIMSISFGVWMHLNLCSRKYLLICKSSGHEKKIDSLNRHETAHNFYDIMNVNIFNVFWLEYKCSKEPRTNIQ